VRATAPTEDLTSPRRRADPDEATLAARSPFSGPSALDPTPGGQTDEFAPTHLATPPRPRRVTPVPTREERRVQQRARATQRRQWARDLLRRFQF
jgi:hypothetical protein